jgi:hypothetical protein
MKQSIKNLLILAIILFVLGAVITLMGALAKLQHWPWAGTCLISGIIIHACSYLLGGFILIQTIRSK